MTSLVLRRCAFLLAPVLFASHANGQTLNASPDSWPTQAWRESSPEAQGMDSRTLARAVDYLREHGVTIHAMIIVRNGRAVVDATFFPYQANDLHDLASVTKSVTATLVGIATAKKQIAGVDAPVLPLFGWPMAANDDPRKRRLTIESLLTMTSGLACEWMPNETTVEDMQRSADWVRFMLNRPMVAEPGSTFAYCSPGMHLLSGVISRVTGSSALEFARRELFQPLGIRDADWPADAHGISHGWGDLHLHPRDMAKLGLLWLNGGNWEGRQIVPADWMSAARKVQSRGTGWAKGLGYGYGLWVDPAQTPPTFGATGRGGQRIRVIPDKRLVVVLAGRFEVREVSHFITEAIRSDRALPEDAEGKAMLDAAIAAAARPPQPRPPAPLPPIASALSGRRFTLDDNPLGLKTLRLSFLSPAEAVLQLDYGGGRVEQRPVGLDGVPRVSPGGRFGLPVALSGGRYGDDGFTFDYDEVANINCYRVRLKLAGHDLSVEVEEQTGLVHAQFKGRDPTGK